MAASRSNCDRHGTQGNVSWHTNRLQEMRDRVARVGELISPSCLAVGKLS